MQKRETKYNDKTLDIYFRQIKAFPLLTFDEELKLSAKIQKGDKEALHKLVNSNLRLVVRIAGMSRKHDIPLLDIIQEGNMGLIHAAEKYDYKKNVRFSTYANWWIKQYIGRFLSNKRRVVRLPVRKEAILRKIQYTYHALCQKLMYQPRNSDIAKELGLPLRDVEKIINIASISVPVELNVNCNEYDGDIIDIHEDYTYNPERDCMKQFSRDSALRILNKLKDREKRVLSYRYQLNGYAKHTLREVADILELSPESVRQIEKKAIREISSYANELKECVYSEAM